MARRVIGGTRAHSPSAWLRVGERGRQVSQKFRLVDLLDFELQLRGGRRGLVLKRLVRDLALIAH
jgi:hypothetical protein